jgi:hypothetical protein
MVTVSGKRIMGNKLQNAEPLPENFTEAKAN